MNLISIRWRDTVEPPTVDLGAVARTIGLLLSMPASWVGAQLVWQHAGGALLPPRALGLVLSGDGLSPLPLASLLAPWGIFIGLRLARVVDRTRWAPAWALGAPWCLQDLNWLLPQEALLAAWLLPLPLAWFDLWPLGQARPRPLHRARWATRGDLRQLLVKPSRHGLPPSEGLVLGRMDRDWLLVRSRPQHRELGGVLVVGRPRSGKGLLGVTQVLGAWQRRSLVCTDLKGELHASTAGWRARTGRVIVLDPTGVGQRFDPLAERDTEDDLYRAARLLHIGADWDGSWHPTPKRWFVVTLVGEMEFTTSDGETRRFGPGSLCLLDDTSGKGHNTRVLSGGDWSGLGVDLAQQEQAGPSAV